MKASKTSYKKVNLPQGLKRALVIPKSSEERIQAEEYDRLIVDDFEMNRAQYQTVWILGVPVKVKVEKSKG